jgi:hypothetical protein
MTTLQGKQLSRTTIRGLPCPELLPLLIQVVPYFIQSEDERFPSGLRLFIVLVPMDISLKEIATALILIVAG